MDNNNYNTAEELVKNFFLGGGVEVSNVTINGQSNRRNYVGTFQANGSNIGIPQGIVLTTGRAGGSFSNSGNTTPWEGYNGSNQSDAQLTALAGNSTRDATILEFDFVPVSDTIRFRYVFASEEYIEYVCSEYNDVFAFYLSGGTTINYPAPGVNLALIPGTNIEVAINTVNSGFPGGNANVGTPCNLNFPFYYVNNLGGTTVQYDGFTTVFEAVAIVTPCENYHIKLAIADVIDRFYDSAVFLQNFESNLNSLDIYYQGQNSSDSLYEGCQTGSLFFELDQPFAFDFSLPITLGGTATNGTDFPAIPSSVFFAAGDTLAEIIISPLADSLVEGNEILEINIDYSSNLLSVCSESFQISILEEAAAQPFLVSCDSVSESEVFFSWPDGVGLTFQVSTDNGNTYINPNLSDTSHVVSGLNPGDTVSILVNSFDPGWVCPEPIEVEAICATIPCTFTAVNIVTDSIRCFGDSTGQASVSVEGGTPPFSYIINNNLGQIDSVFSDLPAGWHFIEVLDVFGCAIIDSFYIFENNLLELNVASNPVLCNGGDDGQLTLSGSGGIPPYSYSLDGTNWQTNNIFNNFFTGSYAVFIQDDVGCITSILTTISEPPLLTWVDIATTSITCMDSCGTITMNVIGGSIPYEYSFDNGATWQIDNILNCAIESGDWPVIVRDVNGCFISDTAVVQDDRYIIQDTLNLEFCTGDTIFTGNEIYNSSGYFTQNLLDVNSCDSILHIFIIELLLKYDTLNIEICYGEEYDGINYYNNEILEETFNTPQCDSFLTTFITVLNLDTTYLTDASCSAQDTGIFEVILPNQNGCDSIIYTNVILLEKDTTYLTDASCSSQDTGIYEVILSNQNGCDSIIYTNVILLEKDTTYLTDASCSAQDTGIFEVILPNQNGCDSFIYTSVSLLEKDTTYLADASCSPQDTGIFEVILSNQNGCDSIIYITVELLLSDTIYLDSLTCFSSDTGIFNYYYNNQYGCDSLIVVSKSLYPYIDFNVDTVLCPGTSFLGQIVNQPVVIYEEFFNANGCLDSIVYNIDLFNVIDPVIQGEASFCEGGFTELTVSNFESYFWSTGDTAASIQIITEGIYGVTVSDVNGCTSENSFEVFPPVSVDINALSQTDFKGFDVRCADSEDGIILANISGGIPPYSLVWNTGSTNIEIINLSAGDYSITVTDAIGCIDEDNITLNAPPPLFGNLVMMPVSCFGLSDGQILLQNPSGGVPPYQYQLNNTTQSDTLFSNVSSGVYDVAIIDENNCEYKLSATIPQPDPVEVFAIENYIVELGESVQLEVIPAFSPDSIIWSPADFLSCTDCLNPTANPLESIEYNVFLWDENGCETSTQLFIEVQKNRNVFIPNIFTPDGDGLNDLFQVYTGGEVEKINSIKLFDRWGELIFEEYDIIPNDPTHGWNGTYKGKDLNPAIFIYLIEVQYKDKIKEKFSGDFLLWR